MYRTIVLIVFLAVLLFSVFFFWGEKGQEVAEHTVQFMNTNEECIESVAVLDRNALPPITLPQRTPPEGYKKYRSEEYRFSVFYRETRVVQEYPEANGAITVTFQNPETLRGFQVFITPYTKDHITEARFKADIRTGVMEASTTVPLDGVCATAFLSRSIAIGDTSEVWAIHNGFLYEITTFRELDDVMQQVIDSWRFL